jgi:hypothetical protein
VVDGLTRSDERATRSSGSSARSGRRRARILAARIGGQGVRRTGVLAGRGVPPRRSRFCAPARSAHNRPEHGLRPLSPPLVGEVSAVGWRSQLAVFDVDRRVAESFAALVVGRPDLSRTGADRGWALERSTPRRALPLRGAQRTGPGSRTLFAPGSSPRTPQSGRVGAHRAYGRGPGYRASPEHPTPFWRANRNRHDPARTWLRGI